MIFPSIWLEGRPDRPPDPKALNDGIELLESVIEYCPQSWPSYWMKGKAHQALGDHHTAYESFKKAHRIQIQPEVLRELCRECLYLDKYQEALYYSTTALKFAPDDPTLEANVACTSLMVGKLDEAELWANKALTKLPGDEPAHNILKIIAQIRQGKRQVPKSFVELEVDETEDHHD